MVIELSKYMLIRSDIAEISTMIIIAQRTLDHHYYCRV